MTPPITPKPNENIAAASIIIADGVNHTAETIASRMGVGGEARMMALVWCISGEIAKIPDPHQRKEVRKLVDRQISINLSRILSKDGG